MSLRTAALLAAFLPAQTAGALDLDYISHLDLHRPEIDLTEPSGLAVSPDGSGFWIVSDETRKLFRLEANGDLRAATGRDDRMRDLEGITLDARQGRLLAVSERNASIILIATDPPHRVRVIEVAALPGPTGLGALLEDRQNGLEGIAVHPKTGAVFVLKEDAPRLLIEIAPSLDRVVSVRRLGEVLPAGEDVSGLAIDPDRDGFWIVSDTGKSVYFLPNDGGPVRHSALTWRKGDKLRRLNNPEGIALSPDGRSLFVVTDDGRHSRLVHYDIRTAP